MRRSATVVGAALMGACGQYVSERAVFYLTAALTLPALLALLPLRRFARDRRDAVPTRDPDEERRPSAPASFACWRIGVC